MNQKEKNLFLELCSFRDASYSKIKTLLTEGAATPTVLGMLFENRMAAVAFQVLKEMGLLEMINREFRNALKIASVLGTRQNEDFEACLILVSKLLDACKVPYALLKGAYLFGQYPEGARTSNDIDILVASEHVRTVSEKLKEAGFEQGYLRNGVFVPATRQQIVESKMTRGETVPFIKEVGFPFIQYLEVDINFSLDYKNSDDCVLKDMLSRAERTIAGNAVISTLDKYDFMVHLCTHLYKEATTMPWLRMKRDMTFYKYCDIYALLYDYSTKDAERLIERAEKCGAKTELLYCLKSIYFFFKIKQPALRKYLRKNPEELDEVIAPSENKRYRYKITNPAVRFFKQDRMALLEEVMT